MPPVRRRAVFFLIATIIVLAVAAAVIAGRKPGTEEDKPRLRLLTSLPLVFPEGFSLGGGGSAALTALEKRYTVEPINIADAASLQGSRLLMMAHPRAQTAEALVDLDRWVRQGGAILLLADPQLDWPSERPLGDALRPPPSFADTGLLKHWGLTLYSPVLTGRSQRDVDGVTWRIQSPGELESDGSHCIISGGGLIGRCRIGNGRATVIADADLLDPGQVGNGADANLEVILDELQRLEAESSRSRAGNRLIHKADHAERTKNSTPN